MPKRREILLKEDDEGFQVYYLEDYSGTHRWVEIRHFDIPGEAAALEAWLRTHMAATP